MRHRRHLSLVVLAGAAVAWGCSDAAAPNEDDLATFDAAVVAADGALETLELMHGPGLGLPLGIFPAFVGARPDCPAVGARFRCAPVVRDGVTYTRTVTYFDADGNPQTAFDEMTTAAISYEITVEGTRGRSGWEATVNRSYDLTVTGLLDGTGYVTWNGTTSGNVSGSRHFSDGEPRSYDMTSSAEVRDVQVPYPRREDSWPLSGSILRTISMTRDTPNGTRSFTREVLVTFNGTSEVTLTVNGETFTVDLTERMGHDRPIRGRGPGAR